MGIFNNIFKKDKNMEKQPTERQAKNDGREQFIKGLRIDNRGVEVPPRHNDENFIEKVLIHLGADKSILNNPGVLDEIKKRFQELEQQFEEVVEEYSQNPNPTEEDFMKYISCIKGDRIFTKQELDFMHKDNYLKQNSSEKIYTISVDSKTGTISFQSVKMGESHEQVDFSKGSKGTVIRKSSAEFVDGSATVKGVQEFNSDGVEMKLNRAYESKLGETLGSYSIQRDSKNPFILKCESLDSKTEIKEFSVGCYEALDECLNRDMMQWKGLKTYEEAAETYNRNEHTINMSLLSKKSQYIRSGQGSKVEVVKGIEEIRDDHIR